MIELVLKAIWFILPAYCANSFPLLINKLKLHKYNKSIDNGLKIKNKELLGKNKTWIGLFLGIIGGTVIGGIQSIIPLEFLTSDFKMTITLAFFLSTGAMVGDLIGSLIKRRLNYSSGRSLPLLDQLDFILGALIFGAIILPISLNIAIILLVLTPFFHLSGNLLAYKLKIKNVPW